MENSKQPAFPISYETPVHPKTVMHEGLTKRELIAAMAMQGYCANKAEHISNWNNETLAKASVETADALLTQLNK